MMRKLLCVVCLLTPALLSAQSTTEKATVYRWKGDDGAMVFSTTPPPKGVDAEEMTLRDADSVIRQEKPPAAKRSADPGDFADERREERSALKQRIFELDDKLEKLRVAYKKGEAPNPEKGETQHLVNGYTRLTEAYFARREREAREIKALEKQLDALWSKFNKLR